MSNSIRALVRTSWLMAGLSVLCGLALLIDPRTLDGAPIWLKPAKFAVSLCIYGFTLAWILRQLPNWPRVVCLAAWTTTLAALIELGLIAMQSGRGVASHFNTGTPFDAAVFGTMGLTITAQTIAAGVAAISLWCQPFTDRALGWALRLGLTLSVIGSSVGGLMVRPTQMQLAAEQATGKRPRNGSHSVGGEDGGPGFHGLRWSTEHGDIRAAHFVGLHAMQVIPLVAFFSRRWKSDPSRIAFVAGTGISYGTLFAILLAQAFAGQPVTKPSGGIQLALELWVAATAALGAFAWFASRNGVDPNPSPTKEVA